MLIGALKSIAAAVSRLEANLKGEPSAVRALLGHDRPHPRPVWSAQIGIAASTRMSSLACFGVGALRAAR
jgi:hypothetical protein